MGGLGPGIGGAEYLVIAVVALLVVGPERLPVMLRQLGKMVAKARGMANDFRASFDEMARQSELDELRKEVQALRDVQGSIGQGMVRLGDEANAAFKDIKTELDTPAQAEPPAPAVTLDQPEFPEPQPAVATEAAAKVAKARKSKSAPAKPKETVTKTSTAKPRTAQAKRPRVSRTKKIDL